MSVGHGCQVDGGSDQLGFRDAAACGHSLEYGEVLLVGEHRRTLPGTAHVNTDIRPSD